jgi:hypothetical protein
MSGYPTGFQRWIKPESKIGINKKNNLFNCYLILMNNDTFKLIRPVVPI